MKTAFQIFVNLDNKPLAVETALVEVPHAHGPVGQADMTVEAMNFISEDSFEYAELAAKHVQWKSFETGIYARDIAVRVREAVERIDDEELEVKVLSYLASVAALQIDDELHTHLVARARQLVNTG